MLVSVIIPTRNRAERIRAVLDALLADPYPHKEIVVADGASTDGTVELLQSYGDRVRWVSERDGGEFHARNRAVGLSTGDVIRNLSDDDIPVAGAIEVAVAHLEAHPEVDILFGQSRTYYVRRDGTKVLADTRRKGPGAVTIPGLIYGRDGYVLSETAFFRRRVVERIGPFEQVRGGDYEYWARAASAGLRLAISETVFADHYRFEDGEAAMAGVYRDLIGANAMLATRYGSAWDRFYAPNVWLPMRRLRYDVQRLLPPRAAEALRAALWRVRSGRRGPAVSGTAT